MKKLNDKAKKIINIACNVLIGVIFVFVILFAVMAISNKNNGYNNLFGYTFLSVVSGSMEGPNDDSFNEGDMVIAKILKDDQKGGLEQDQVITFWTFIEGKKVINTHRILRVENTGTQTVYATKGDANPVEDELKVMESEVIAVYSSKIKGGAGFLNLMQGQTGFMIMVVVPSFLAVAYCVYLFIINLKGYKKEKDAETDEVKKVEREQELLAEKERIRQELMLELKQKEAATGEPVPEPEKDKTE